MPAPGSAARDVHTPAQLLRGAYSLLANTAVTAALGMAFWVLAARLFPSSTVGRDTVLISTMVELSTLCQLGLGNGILRFLPDLGRRSALALGCAYALTCGVALLAGTGFVLLAPLISSHFDYLQASGLAVAFVLALVLWGLFSLQDAALVATRRGPWVPVENGAFGVLKLALLPTMLAAGAANGIFVAWTLPMAALLVPVNLLVFRHAIPAHLARHEPAHTIARMGRSRALRFLAQDYLASVFTQATLTMLPLLVLAILGAVRSAHFAMPFTIAIAFDTFAYGACSALVVEGALDPERLRALAGLFLLRVLAPLAALATVLALAAPLVMLPFGATYAQHGSPVLRLLLCASLVRLPIAIFSAISRVQGRGMRLTAVELALLGLALGFAVPLAYSNGIQGVAAAWLAANILVCLTLTPLLAGALRAPRGATARP